MAVMPHTDAEQALEAALSLDIPFWPQLPRLSYYEDMYVQASEHFPGIVLDMDKKTLAFSMDKFVVELEETLLHFEEPAYFDISEQYSDVYHRFLKLDLLERPAIRGQLEGPISFGLNVLDQDKRPIIFDDTVRPFMYEFMAKRINVQLERLKKLNPNAFMFIDEPGLQFLFSALSGYDSTAARRDMEAFLSMIDRPRGVHLCGNPDWDFLLRMDLDTTGRKGAHDRLLQAFKSRVADILLGTQMIAKGLDFEPVTIVGVIAAEVGVGLPDFRASERVFQLLTQVAGRAGRGKRSGIVVIQSFSDQFPAIRHAREHDFTGFYDQEIRRREKTGYPPFSRLILIRVSAPQAAEALRAAGQIASRLRTGPHRMYRVLGPAPAPFIRLKNMYRWHVVLKINTDMDRSGARTKKIINDRLGNDLQKFRSATRVIVDVDPLDML